jgi:hypothetical protein
MANFGENPSIMETKLFLFVLKEKIAFLPITSSFTKVGHEPLNPTKNFGKTGLQGLHPSPNIMLPNLVDKALICCKGGCNKLVHWKYMKRKKRGLQAGCNYKCINGIDKLIYSMYILHKENAVGDTTLHFSRVTKSWPMESRRKVSDVGVERLYIGNRYLPLTVSLFSTLLVFPSLKVAVSIYYSISLCRLINAYKKGKDSGFS